MKQEDCKIDATHKAFHEGYWAGLEHPVLVKGSTLDQKELSYIPSPNCSSINPYNDGTFEYKNFKAGYETACYELSFETAIL